MYGAIMRRRSEGRDTVYIIVVSNSKYFDSQFYCSVHDLLCVT